MENSAISAGRVVWNLDADPAKLDAALASSQGKVDEFAAGVTAADDKVKESFDSTAATAEASGAKVAESAKATKDAVVAANDEIDASNTVGSKSFDKVGLSAAASSSGISKGMGLTATAIAGGIAVAAGLMVKSAADFQASMTRLVTSAGESESNLQLVSNGVLQVARDTGTSSSALASAMYIIESGGQHGAAGLTVLKAAAQGAKTENADLATVADAVTSAMTDYHYAADQAATVTSKLVAATGQGKTTFQELAAAMPAILPVASAAHISLNDILGDLASMTLHGMSAEQASQNLADAVRHLQNPLMTQSKELAALGLNSTVVAQQLGNKGLSGTINEIADAIESRMGPGSTAVILNMEDALKGLPQAVQAVSQGVLNGTASWSDWNSATKDLTVTQRSQAQSFATLVNGMHTIGTQQMSGAQVMQTYDAAMQKAMGTSTGLNVALMIGGQNAGNTARAIQAVSNATADASGNVKGWSDIQGNFNQQMSVLKQDIATTGIAIGMALLPALTTFARDLDKILTPVANFVSNNKSLAAGLMLTVGALAAFVALSWGVQKGVNGMRGAFNPLIGIVKKFTSAMWESDAAEGVGQYSQVGKELDGIGTSATRATPLVENLAGKLKSVSGVALSGAGAALPEASGVGAGVVDAGAAVAAAGGLTAIGTAAAVALPLIVGAGVAYYIYQQHLKAGQSTVQSSIAGWNQWASSMNFSTGAAQNLTGAHQALSSATTKLHDDQAKLTQINTQALAATAAYGRAQLQLNQDVEKYGANSPQVQADQAKINSLAQTSADLLNAVAVQQGVVNDDTNNYKTALSNSQGAQSTFNTLLQATKDQLGGIGDKVATLMQHPIIGLTLQVGTVLTGIKISGNVSQGTTQLNLLDAVVGGSKGSNLQNTFVGNLQVSGSLQSGGGVLQGGRAGGGPVTAGSSYLVGEEGMEIFTPNEDGYVIPNNAVANGTAASIANSLGGTSGSGASAPVININLNANGVVARSRSEWRDIMKDGIAAINEELRARRLPLLANGALAGRSTTA